MKHKLPVLFIGHGNPLNAIEANEFSRAWIDLGKRLPQPKVILCISAHWVTDGIKVTASETPKQIYDFYGFPDELYQVKYPVKGDPKTAQRIVDLLKPEYGAELDDTWGIDHGTWSILTRLYPKANIPVIQLSLGGNLSPQDHWQVAKKLLNLRYEDVLIIGSGNLVHNLGLIEWSDIGFPWAIDFDLKIKMLILENKFSQLINYSRLTHWEQAIPTNEHFLPLLYALAVLNKGEKVNFFNGKVTMGSISMRSFIAD
jgi:4,5-DOPA dioxygenase extradiol